MKRPQFSVSGQIETVEGSDADELLAKRIAALVLNESKKENPNPDIVVGLAAINNAYVYGILDQLIDGFILPWLDLQKEIEQIRKDVFEGEF